MVFCRVRCADDAATLRHCAVLLLLSAVLPLLAWIVMSCFEAYCDVYVGSTTPGLFVSTDSVCVRHRETHLYAQ